MPREGVDNLLSELKECSEVQNYSTKNLKKLADNCRNRIIEVISQTGGHLASSLGSVELTVALAKVFNFKKDKIIWDVGHQTYTYKLLTGRNDQFEFIGKKRGIAKFLSRKESKYDHFGAGHASTSISAALGINVGKTLNHQNFKTIAVIGDGSMTGGVAFEALNHAGHLDENIVVILNDNDMSIDSAVGALSKTILNISSSKTFNLLRAEFIKQHRDGKFPLAIKNTLQRVNESFMTFFTKGIWFEKLNFRYFGQVEGHDIKKLVSLLKVVKNVDGPVLLHVITRKGKGFPEAEKNAARFHGIGPFNPKTGVVAKSITTGKSYTSVWSDTFYPIIKKDNKVVAISAAMIANTGLSKMQNEFPDRVFDVGIAESHAVIFAGGLATQKIKPFIVIYSTFLQRAIDSIVHDIALQNLPVKFILDRAGFVGADGATHHGMLDLTYLRMIPNMVIMVPKNGIELQSMIKLAYEYNDGPIAIRFPRGNTETYLDLEKETAPEISFGKGELINQGKDILILAVGTMVKRAQQVAEELQKEGLSVGLINARFVKPLDDKLILKMIKKSSCIVTLEENARIGGFGSAVMELLSANNLFKPIATFGIPDQFFGHATPEEQIKAAGLDTKSLFNKIKVFYLKNNIT
ncbi:MAG: 1-deoxy-D-xylulose-5-phosphate synthase [Deltaproteobacteria bacterium]|jgi:1-deoxy-D-xylulose-5-phosphate synthase|nr:1-deoxy-D-xylulose-5-phosphate synthase [Deltaproteobacteria bacterium]MBT4528118.1 1-deoxy-D-xylulose-5-phosphate synthase [Deltaproteobacteria bacterium]